MSKSFIGSVFLSHAAIASVLGDWFYIKRDTVENGSCHLYRGDAHNLFGNLCDNAISDLESTVNTLQALVCANLAFSVVYLFANFLKWNEMKMFKLLLGLTIFVGGIITCILWHTTDKSKLPPDDVVNYFGVGWWMQLLVVIFSLVVTLLVFTEQ